MNERLKKIEEEKIKIKTHICKLKTQLNKRECDLLQEMNKYKQEIKRVMMSYIEGDQGDVRWCGRPG